MIYTFGTCTRLIITFRLLVAECSFLSVIYYTFTNSFVKYIANNVFYDK